MMVSMVTSVSDQREKVVATRKYISCPYCRDHQSHVTPRRWWDYLLRLPQILLGKVCRRCEHCLRRFWVSRDEVPRGEEPDVAPRIAPNRW
jgi:hypothetical protein